MAETQKVASTGRFGSRYGVGIRRKLLKVEPMQLQKHKCPNCGMLRIKRIGKGLFFCTKCSREFVGGSYIPQTLAGSLISKMVSQRMFSTELLESLKQPAENAAGGTAAHAEEAAHPGNLKKARRGNQQDDAQNMDSSAEAE